MIKNLEKINIIKRSEVEQAVKIASKDSNIEKIVVFGSSIRDDCRESSDIDFCFFVIPNHDKKVFNRTLIDICKACKSDLDTLRYDLLRGSICDVINNKGVIVYDKL